MAKVNLVRDSFKQHGYAIIPNCLSTDLVNQLISAIAQYSGREASYGIRDLHLKVTAIAELSKTPIIQKILQQYGDRHRSQLIKAIFFDKNLKHNWAVPWHQDKTLAVAQKVELSKYSNWTINQGVPHVQPPLEVLKQIVTLRIALDQTNSDNGALKLISGSHKLGIVNQQQIEQAAQNKTATICNLNQGDILVMSPLLLHASDKSKNSNNRRTIHLEYCSYPIPDFLVRA